MNCHDIKIASYDGAGFAPQIFFGGWRVAILNHQSSQTRGHVSFLERHHQTDEVFVLLAGTAVLIAAGNGDTPGAPNELPMEYGKLYNVPKDVWHAIITRPDSKLLIVENADTGTENSSYCEDIETI